MVERVHIRRNPFRFRISKPGKSVDSSNLDDFIIHEGQGVIAPYITGTVTVPNEGNVLVSFGRTYSRPALVMLKCASGVVAYPYQVYAVIQPDMASMRIYNTRLGAAQTVTYYVYWNSIGGD